MIIGFAGKAGAGKDYAARMVADMFAERNVKTYKFADPMKQFCKAVFDWTEDHTDGDLKEKEDANGICPRVALQKLGTEWGRTLHEDVWVDCCLRQIYRDSIRRPEKPTSGGFTASWVNRRVDVALITDVRFTNECQAIQKHGGQVIFIDGGESATEHSGHPSETSLADVAGIADLVIDNRNKSERLLFTALEHFLKNC